MSDIFIFQINPKTGMVKGLLGDRMYTLSANYGSWGQKYFRQKFLFWDEERLSWESLKQSYQENREICMQIQSNINHRWISVKTCINKKDERILLVIQDIHEKLVRIRKEKRLEVFHSCRNRLEKLKRRGFYCGMIVLDASHGYKVLFAEEPLVRYLTENRENKNLQQIRSQLESRVEEQCQDLAVKGFVECDWSVGDMDYMEINIGSQGTERWVHLYGSTVVTERGNIYYYLLYSDEIPGQNPPYEDAMGEQYLVEHSGGYMFEWNIGDNSLLLPSEWENKFRRDIPAASARRERRLEDFVRKEDRHRLRVLFNSIYKPEGKTDSILIRFLTHGDKDSYCWCNVRLISVLYHKDMPMYVVGNVSDVSDNLRAMLGAVLGDYDQISTKKTEDAHRYVDQKILVDDPEGVHAVFAIRMEEIIPQQDEVGRGIITYQYIEVLTRMTYPNDRVWMEDGELYFFLYQIGSRRNARQKANRMVSVISQMHGKNMAMDIGVAVCPEDGQNCEELLKFAREDIWNGIRLDKSMTELGTVVHSDAGSQVSLIADIAGE